MLRWLLLDLNLSVLIQLNTAYLYPDDSGRKAAYSTDPQLWLYALQNHFPCIYVKEKTPDYYPGFPLAQAERGLAEGDGRTVGSAWCLGRDVVMGAPTKPTAVAVPVTNPTRESEGRERGGEGQSV